ncbi:MAG: SnoaL-like domain-containing protein [Beijerinckiaceae bacterium]
MTTAEIAAEFTALLKDGKHVEAAEKFNAKNIVSIEAMEGPMARVEGAEAVAAKSKWWMENHQVHKMEVEGPFVNGDRFMVEFDLDVTANETGIRQEMEEIALYTVKNGKIVEEQFFPEHGDDDEEDEDEDEESDEEGVHRQG